MPEIQHHCNKTPFLLVGTQNDLRDEPGSGKAKTKPISQEQGEKLAKDLKAVKYVECSALTQVKKGGKYFRQNYSPISVGVNHRIYSVSINELK